MKFERCTNAQFIPRNLLEQLPNEGFNADNFYEFMSVALESSTQFLFLLISDRNEIMGFLWCEINVLEKILFINLLSVDKELWGDGEMVDLATDFLKKYFDLTKFSGVLWSTDRPALFEKKGFKRSTNILMEYTGE